MDGSYVGIQGKEVVCVDVTAVYHHTLCEYSPVLYREGQPNKSHTPGRWNKRLPFPLNLE